MTRWQTQAFAISRDAALITALSGTLGLLVNQVHPEAIPYFAEQSYEILVPCPEPGGDAKPLPAGAVIALVEHSFVVDARLKDAFQIWHLGDAVNIPYDYLDPTPPAQLQELASAIARSQAQRVIVYGDGAQPDTGEQLAREIAGFGINNVHYVQGGAPALQVSEATP